MFNQIELLDMRFFITLILSLATLTVIAKETAKERKLFLDNVFELLENNIANPEWLKEESFINFKAKVYSDKMLSLDDKAFNKAFRKESHKLPFTHFYLIPKRTQKSTTTTTKTVSNKKRHTISWKAINNKTAYLDIRSFSGGVQKMITVLKEIGTDKYENLIIDLRNNGGGTLDAPVILGQFLTTKPIDAGVYLTRKWFNKESRPASINDIANFPYLKDFTYQGIMKMFAEEAAFRMVVPGHNRPVFKGKVFILINRNTGSACEPLIHLLKKENVATLVGGCSAGAMLSANTFTVNNDYNVFIPIADYQTPDGARIDKVGVEPDITVDSKEALNYTVNNLIK
jgi:C-terminal processing protease CtpA/Prc